MAELGEEFRSAREARGLTLSDVGDQIHIRSVYLAAIEEEDWHAIGAPVYVRGFIRTYARFLGIDVESAVERFAASPTGSPSPAAAISAMPETAARRASRSPSVGLWIGTVVAVVLVVLVGYNYYQFQSARDRSVIAAGPAAPADQATSVATAAPSAAPVARAVRSAPPVVNGLAVRLSAPSWLRVAVDGQVAMEGTFPAGTARSFHGKHAILRVGNAGGVNVAVNGKDVGKLGAAGDVVERSFAIARE